jgi:hypothetical protein
MDISSDTLSRDMRVDLCTFQRDTGTISFIQVTDTSVMTVC